MEGVSDALAEGGNAESLASSIKSRISKAWVIIRTLDEIGGELRVSTLPLLKAQNAGNELNVMLEEGGDTVRMSRRCRENSERSGGASKKAGPDTRAEGGRARGEKRASQPTRSRNRSARRCGEHSDAILRLIQLKEELLNSNEDGDFAEEYLHAEENPPWSDRSTLRDDSRNRSWTLRQKIWRVL